MGLIANLFQLAGALLVAFGVALVFLPAGVIVAGGGLLYVGYLMERGSHGTSPPAQPKR